MALSPCIFQKWEKRSYRKRPLHRIQLFRIVSYCVVLSYITCTRKNSNIDLVTRIVCELMCGIELYRTVLYRIVA